VNMPNQANGQISVLLVEDSPGDRRLVEELLKDAGGSLFLIDWVDRLSAALERLGGGGVDVVLLDLALPDSAGLETFRSVSKRFPDVPIVLLTGLNNEALALQAVTEGAQEYLIKGHAKGASVARVIRYAVARSENLRMRLADSNEPKRGKVIGLLGAKGGVGTTTLAANLAADLARRKKAVILAELMPVCGSLAALMRQTPRVHLGSLLDLEPAALDHEELETHLVEVPFGFKVLFAPPKFRDSGERTAVQVETILAGLTGMADYTLVDLSDCRNAYLEPAARVCSFLLMIVDPEPIAMISAKSTLALLESYNAMATAVGIVLVNRSALSSCATMAEARTELGRGIVGAVPPVADPLAAAHKAGKLLLLTHPESRAVAAISAIASRLMESPVGTMSG
jgi:Flp pilus assembly CpaE family ATPase